MIVVFAAGAWQRGGRKVTGTVMDAGTRQPVVGARVEYEESGADEIGATTTDRKGTFEFGAGTLGTVTVYADGYGTAYQRWPPVTSTSTLEIALMPPSRVTGTVADISSGRALAAEITVMVRTRDSLISASAETDDRGEFVIEDMLPGPAVVEAAAEGYAPVRQSLTIGDHKSTNTARIRLMLGGALRGTVLDSSGEPVAGAEIIPWYSSDDFLDAGSGLESYIGGYTVTKTDGSFGLNQIVPGEDLSFQAELDGETSNTITVTLDVGELRDGVTLRFE